MSSQDKAESKPRAEDQLIFDGDFHIQVPMETLFDYVENDEIRKKLERFGEPTRPTQGIKGAYVSEKPQRYAGSAGATTHGAAIKSDDIAAAMDDINLDYLIATPPPDAPFASGRYPTVIKELIKAYNDYLLENVIDVDRGIFGSIQIPRWDTEATLSELSRVGNKEGVIGIADWINFDSPWGDEKYDPILETVADLDLPLVLHPGGELPQRRDSIASSYRTYTEVLVGGFAYKTISNVINMIMTGVFDTYPELDVLIQEADISWIPYVAHRSDEVCQVYGEDIHLVERILDKNNQYLERMPSEYLLDNFYVTTQPISLPKKTYLSDAMLKLCHAEDMLVFSSDWPHGSMDTPDWVFENNAIDDDLRSEILTGNAEELFGIELAD